MINKKTVLRALEAYARRLAPEAILFRLGLPAGENQHKEYQKTLEAIQYFMGITDPIRVVYYPERWTWILVQGKETFYDDDGCMREWDTMLDAIEWCRENLRVEPIFEENAPEEIVAEKKGAQLSMFGGK